MAFLSYICTLIVQNNDFCVETVNQYSIDYVGLPCGIHTFDFAVDGELFRSMESNEIRDGRCNVHVCLNRLETRLMVNVVISGSVTVECDRCLEDCDIPIDFSGVLEVLFSETEHDYDGFKMWIAKGDRLSLKQYIYESIVVSLPYRRVHEEGGCNPDMMARFTPAD